MRIIGLKPYRIEGDPLKSAVASELGLDRYGVCFTQDAIYQSRCTGSSWYQPEFGSGQSARSHSAAYEPGCNHTAHSQKICMLIVPHLVGLHRLSRPRHS